VDACTSLARLRVILFLHCCGKF